MFNALIPDVSELFIRSAGIPYQPGDLPVFNWSIAVVTLCRRARAQYPHSSDQRFLSAFFITLTDPRPYLTRHSLVCLPVVQNQHKSIQPVHSIVLSVKWFYSNCRLNTRVTRLILGIMALRCRLEPAAPMRL
ncbi:hypothetical protein RRG08_009464 [Elysia crispata]|uniref:Uncharacterized protein n=1 Tax=Elysia crispata TaxID=231223 RepID=A0AAE1ASX1_9GAST|nr:hypothetical protein RRG08_009464 [Elysia crispata]